MTLGRSDVTVGDVLPGQKFQLERADLVRYAGASGDFNPIHWSPDAATAIGLPGVIAHGMLTMGLGCRVVTDWLGDPGALLECGVRFTRPVLVAADEPTTIEVSGVVTAIDERARANIELKVAVDGQTVLSRARATVRLDPDR